MNSKFKVMAALVFAFFQSGCATIHSNYLAKDSQVGYVYSGANMDLLAMKILAVCGPGTSKKEDGTSYWLSVPAYTFMSLVFLIDLPFSIAADTLLLPVDLVNDEPEHGNRFSPAISCEEIRKRHGSGSLY